MFNNTKSYRDTHSQDLYSKAGIKDIADFYQEKFVSSTKATLPNGIDCYLCGAQKNMWFFSNIPANSKILDFGCGSGTLGFLKEKNCELVGIDYSEAGVEIAKNINGYSAGFSGNLSNFSWQDNYFDFVVSIDVFGHIPFEEKNETIEKLKRFLKPNGIMMHGIECGPMDYSTLSPDELKKFVEVDGHVGIESKNANYKRFLNYFRHVDGEVRYTTLVPVEQYKKEIFGYGNNFEPSLKDYLLSLTHDEEKAFDIAGGLAHLALERNKTPSTDQDGGFLFLRASDAPLPPLLFEMHYADSKPADIGESKHNQISLYDNSTFAFGWYNTEEQTIQGKTKVYRYGTLGSRLHILNNNGKKLHIKCWAYVPKNSTDTTSQIYFVDEHTKYCHKFDATGDLEIYINIDINSDNFTLICGSTTAGIPYFHGDNGDIRPLALAISHIEIV